MSLNDLVNATRSAGNPLIANTVTLSGNLSRDMDMNGIPSTNEGYAFLGMAYACASLNGSSIVSPIGNLQHAVVTASFPRNYTGEVVVDGDRDAEADPSNVNHYTTFSSGDFRRGDDHENGLYPTYVYGRKNEEELGDYTYANALNCPDAESKKLILTVIGGIDDWMQWFIDLINAFQTGGVSAKNVSAYFAWCGLDNVDGNYIASHICGLSGGIEKIAARRETRDLLRVGKWTEYRLNFATVVGQLDKMLNEVPEKYMKVFSANTKAAIRTAKEENWNEIAFRRIGTRPLAVLQAWLIVSKQEIENLWSAKRAYGELSIAEKTSLTNWFTNAMKEIKVYNGGFTDTYNDLPQSLKNI